MATCSKKNSPQPFDQSTILALSVVFLGLTLAFQCLNQPGFLLLVFSILLGYVKSDVILKRIYFLCNCYHLRRSKAQFLSDDHREKIVRTMEDLNIVPTKIEEALERPNMECAEDIIELHCVDNEANGFLSIRILRKNYRASCHIFWKRNYSDEIFTNELLNESACAGEFVDNSSDNDFKCGNLTLTVLEAFRSWRICFNGLLRSSKTGKVQHVRINALWSPLCAPFHWIRDSSVEPIAKTAVEANITNIDELQKLQSDLLSGYVDQYGIINGQITFEEEEAQEFYYRGVRRRITLPMLSQLDFGDVKACLIGVSETGFHFTLDLAQVMGVSYENGSIYTPGTRLDPLEEIAFPCDISSVLTTWEKQMLNPHEIFTRFQANKRWFNVGIVLRSQGIKMTMPESGQLLVPCDISFNAVRGQGFFIFSRRHAQTEPLVKQPEEFKSLDEARKKGDVLLVGLDEKVCLEEHLVGGKGSSLATLSQSANNGRDFFVPEAICITTTAFDHHVKANKDVFKAIEDLSKVACQFEFEDDQMRREELKQACQRTVTLLSTTTVTDDLREKIWSKLTETLGDDPDKFRFAVRSSAVGEDSEELSSAGQNQTFLGCRGRESLIQAIQKCWASLYALPSVEYRRQNGQPVMNSMGVVIQKMVDADVAGVIFSRDPLTGNPTNVTITANLGLGESVVSSMSEPDTVIVKHEIWNSETSWRILEKKVGSKKMKIVMGESDSIEERQIEPEDSSKICLSDTLALDLAKIAVHLDRMYRNTPRDIEFAIKESKLYLLQARPITGLSAWTDFELMHEFDSAVAARTDLYSKANTGEVLPDALSPLTSSSCVRAIDLSVQRETCVMSNFPVNPYVFQSIHCSHHNFFLNYLDSVLSMVRSEKVDPHVKACDFSVAGHKIITQSDVMVAADRRGLLNTWQKIRVNLITAKILLKNIYRQKTGNWANSQDDFFQDLKGLAAKSAREIFEELDKGLVESLPTFQAHASASHASTAFQLIVFLILAENSPEWPIELCSDVTSILRSSQEGDIISAGVPNSLKALSELLACREDYKLFLESQSVEEAESWIMKDPKTRKFYLEFKERFKYRGYKEFDLMSVPWGEDPSMVIETLRALVEGIINQGKRVLDDKANMSMEEKIALIQRPLKESTKKALKFIAPYAIGSVAHREDTKAAVIKWTAEFRLVFRLLGQALRREGRVPDEKLVFFVTLHELRKLLNGPSSSIVQKAKRRCRLFDEWNKIKFQEVIHGIPRPIGQMLPSDHDQFKADLTVQGTPVCRGCYKGVARVVTNVANAKFLKKGEVLITTSTDIGWSPYFPLLGGLVTEIGGLISHGAVVAREFGLPSVVGVDTATMIFKTGDFVEIDGTNGTVKRLDKLDECPT